MQSDDPLVGDVAGGVVMDSGRGKSALQPLVWLATAGVVLLAVILGFVVSASGNASKLQTQAAFSQKAASTEDLGQCLDKHLAQYRPQLGGNVYREELVQQGEVLVYNATVWDGVGGVFVDYDILIKNGKIADMAPTGTLRSPVEGDLDAHGRIVTPGLVDTHSHVGVYAWPDTFGTSDGNEMTAPVTSFVRSRDALLPTDHALPHIRSGGVTTSQVLPGSGNLIGGQATVIKMVDSTDVEDLVIPHARRGMKMACGENPKRTYGSKGQMPMSRMGSAYKMREAFEEARNMVEEQERWCNRWVQEGEPEGTSAKFPFDIKTDSLVALLRHEVTLNVHCYMVHDQRMMVRLSREFDFDIASFHHSLESWKIAELLVEEDIAVSTFADSWGFKAEGYDATPYAPKMLHEAGVRVNLKTDHPVIDGKYLLNEAAKAHHYGLEPQAALASVTSEAAKILGLEKTVGTLGVGWDADLVVWDRDPLTVGAQPVDVLINGKTAFHQELPVEEHETHDQTPSGVLQDPNNVCDNPNSSGDYILTGVDVWTMLDGADTPLLGVNVKVRDGIVECVNTEANGCGPEPGFDVVEFSGGVVIPGLVEGGSVLGLKEMGGETGPSDGTASVSMDEAMLIHARDGVRVPPHFRHVLASYKAGVLTSVTRPTGNGLVVGHSVAFSTCCGPVVDDVLLEEAAALHLNLGINSRGSGLSGSVSGQVASLRRLLAGMDSFNSTMVIRAHEAGALASVARLQQEFPEADLVVLGGGEASVVADRLAEAGVAVVLQSRVPPETFDSQLASEQSATLLRDAGVVVAVTTDNEEFARNLRWEAAFAHTRGLTLYESIASVTSTPADLYSLPLGVGRVLEGTPANFIAVDQLNPLSMQGHVRFIGLGPRLECHPMQWPHF